MWFEWLVVGWFFAFVCALIFFSAVHAYEEYASKPYCERFDILIFPTLFSLALLGFLIISAGVVSGVLE